jgi:hypothetical protein
LPRHFLACTTLPRGDLIGVVARRVSAIFAGESFMLAPESGFGCGSVCRRSTAAEDVRRKMRATIGAGIFLALAALLPGEPVAAQNPVGGAIVGGAVGGIIGGALGRGPGAVAGAVIGATAGAAIAAEAQQRNNGYYWWRGGCYYRYPDGSWLQVAPGYC